MLFSFPFFSFVCIFVLVGRYRASGSELPEYQKKGEHTIILVFLSLPPLQTTLSSIVSRIKQKIHNKKTVKTEVERKARTELAFLPSSHSEPGLEPLFNRNGSHELDLAAWFPGLLAAPSPTLVKRNGRKNSPGGGHKRLQKRERQLQ